MTPNFFIIGAPKCGTTSFASWMSEHPKVYLSPIKEPHYYNTDSGHRNVLTKREYDELFKDAKNDHIAIGEASVYYLFSQTAVPTIENEVHGAKYIVMLRNPVEMAPALHEQKLFSGSEHIESFKEAWDLQPFRARREKISRFCRDPNLLLYGEVCKLGKQLERLFNHVPRERIHIIFLDDLKEDPLNQYLLAQEFLSLPIISKTSFGIKNKAKERRWPALRKLIRIANDTRRKLDLPKPKLGIMTYLDSINTTTRTRPPLTKDELEMLKEYFHSDIKLLEHLCRRDLSAWIST